MTQTELTITSGLGALMCGLTARDLLTLARLIIWGE